MADNTTLNAGTGGDTIASDDILGVKFQRVKLTIGADGVNDGDIASGNPLPVTGTVTASGPLTDAQLRATPVPVSGTVTANQGGAPWSMSGSGTFTTTGNLTNNNAAPAATNVGALTALATAANPSFTEGNETLLSIDLQGFMRSSVQGRGASGAALSGNPIRVGAAFNTTQPTVTNGQTVDLQATARGGLIVSPGIDTFTVTANAGSGTFTIAGAVTNAGTFAVQDSEKVADNAAFTDGTTKVQPAGYIFDETAGTALTENDAAAARINANRAQVLTIEDDTTRGRRLTITAANAAKVDGSAVTQPVSAASLPLPSGASTLAEQQTQTTSLQLIDDVIVADNAAFTDGTTKLAMAGFIFDETAGTALTENDAAAARINANRATIAAIEDGATRARYATVTAANALKVDASGVAVPVTDNSGSLTVDAPVGTPVFVRLSDGAAAITNLSTKELRSATGTQTSVSGSATNVTILASNANRLQARIHNHSDEVLYIRYQATATTTNFSERVDPHSTINVPEFYTGIIDGLWDAASGAAKVTEFT